MIPAPLKDKLNQCKTLPSLPAVVVEVIELARLPNTGSKELAELLSQDPSISAKILATANSAIYGGKDISGLQQAINRIGVEGALSLSLSFGLAMHRGAKNGMDLDYFWKRSLISGLAVREIYKLTGLSFEVESVYLAALLQDIGMLALNELDPDIYGVIFHSARSHRQLTSFEEREYTSNHAAIGAWLGQTWGLPDKYTDMIADSHRLPKEVPEDNLNVRVLALSGLLADPWLSGNKEMSMTLAYQAAQDYLKMDEQGFSHLLLRLQDQLPNISRLFDIQAPNKIDTFNLLQDAKHLLVERNLRMMQKLAEQQSEIEQLKKNSARLQEQLKRDPLTQIYNRQYTEQKLDKYFHATAKTGSCLAVVFIDLDYFKILNDQHGHAVGDSALKAFAAALEQELGSGNLAGRYGGEEFVALMPGHAQEGALEFARRLQEYLASTPLLSHNKEDIYISASMGIAIHAPHGKNPAEIFADPDSLLDAADKAMYSAKRTGRNQILLFNSQGGHTQLDD
ncbi:diguanylate cyclase (GGDEF) domain-containing protein [Marinospirillum celere]|uniref:diguanylate cyclase n=1 Tax=Marinospirillum celere TaxID=1122252 RepID=A0A1I1ERW5_9GAMM|nr:GGDEF domain-containing protein [Marinospirillum celere]SFB89386.1 diguanylate cyclase (GGDEF) domain-containing protein [Marinospirillum celere]